VILKLLLYRWRAFGQILKYVHLDDEVITRMCSFSREDCTWTWNGALGLKRRREWARYTIEVWF
jgi:hypothetical protein